MGGGCGGVLEEHEQALEGGEEETDALFELEQVFIGALVGGPVRQGGGEVLCGENCRVAVAAHSDV